MVAHIMFCMYVVNPTTFTVLNTFGSLVYFTSSEGRYHGTWSIIWLPRGYNSNEFASRLFMAWNSGRPNYYPREQNNQWKAHHILSAGKKVCFWIYLFLSAVLSTLLHCYPLYFEFWRVYCRYIIWFRRRILCWWRIFCVYFLWLYSLFGFEKALVWEGCQDRGEFGGFPWSSFAVVE